MAGLLIKCFLLKLCTIGKASYQRVHVTNRIIFSCGILHSVMAGWPECTGWLMGLPTLATQPPSKTSSLKYGTGEQCPVFLFCFAADSRQCLSPTDGLAIGFCEHWGRRGHNRAFCCFSASLLNLTVIRLCRHEGPQTAQGPSSFHKTWPKIHRHEWKTPFRIRPSGMTAPGVVQ